MKLLKNGKYQVLYDLFRSRGVSMNDLSMRLGIARQNLLKRFRGDFQWKEREILAINDMLNLTKKEAEQVWNLKNALKS